MLENLEIFPSFNVVETTKVSESAEWVNRFVAVTAESAVKIEEAVGKMEQLAAQLTETVKQFTV